MKLLTYKKTFQIAFLISSIATMLLNGCSDDEKAKTEVVATSENQSGQKGANSFDHTHGPEVTDMEKHKFEHEFAAQCVDRELNNSANKIEDAERLTKSCECIATYLMKDLTAQEAEKFIKEHEHPQSLRIKFEAAAYECVQEKAKVDGPKLFGKPENTE
jgi:hypothetical protein